MEIVKANIKDNTDNIIKYISKTRNNIYEKKYLFWQYEDPKSNLYLIYDNNNIYGTQGMIPISLRNNHKDFLTHKSETTFVSNELRGKGTFEKMYASSTENAYENGSSGIWGFTALGKLWEKKLNFNCEYELICEATIVAKIFVGIDFKRKIVNSIRFIISQVKKMITVEKYTSNIDYGFTDFNYLSSFDNFWKDADIRLNYNSESVKNRVFNNPKLKYQKLNVWEEKQIVATLIISIDNNILRISDLIYKDDVDHKSMLKSILNFAKSKNLEYVKFWGNIKNPKYMRLFIAFENLSGNKEMVKDMQFIYQFKDMALSKTDFSKFYINGLWTEGFSY